MKIHFEKKKSLWRKNKTYYTHLELYWWTLLCRLVFVNLLSSNIGFDLSSWKTLNSYGSILTREQTLFLLRELGIEEYVGAGCSRTAAPYSPETHPGWNVSSGKREHLNLIECFVMFLIYFVSELKDVKLITFSIRVLQAVPSHPLPFPAVRSAAM